MTKQIPVWVLLGRRTGDNNQLLRLASELKLPFRKVELGYNSLSRVPPGILGATLASIDEQSRAEIGPPWPSLVLGIGNRSVPAALEVRRLSKGKSKLVRLGNPRLHPRNFDLVVTTPQYRVPDAANVIHIPVGISTAPTPEPDRDEAEWLAKLPRPHRLLLIGGDTFMWTLKPAKLAEAAAALRKKDGGSVIAVSSPRSGHAVLDAVSAALRGSEHALIRGKFPRYPVLLADADELYVTADSVAMVSDAVATGKPLGLIVPEQTVPGKLFYGLEKVGLPVPIRDIRRFWTGIQEKGLAGTVDAPIAGKLDEDSLSSVVAAVRSLVDS
jgi:mitochondrial fission protein ELM1